MKYNMDKGALTSADMRHTKYKILYWSIFFSLLLITLIVCVLPVVWIVMAGFKDANEIYSTTGDFWPKKIELRKIAEVWNSMKFYKYYIATFIMAFGNVIFTCVVCGLAGYVLSKVKPMGHKIIFTILFTLTLMPGNGRMVPLYMTFKDFPYLHINMLNTFWPIWLMAATDIFNMILFKNFFDGIPNSLVEAAQIDGASNLRIFFKIILPISSPIFWVVALFTFNGSMGTFFWPYLLISDPKLTTLGVQIYKLKSSTFSVDYQMLALLFAMLPQIVIFALFQKRIMGGITAGAVKG